MRRLLEGEAYLYHGVIHIVKGYQHPDQYIIAYPRYDVLNRRKLLAHELISHESRVYWNCIKQKVPLIPLIESHKVDFPVQNMNISYVLGFFRSIVDKEIYLTGSSLIEEQFNDVDMVVYGSDESTVQKIERLFNQGILSRAQHVLVREHKEKHRDTMKLEEYLRVKKDTILHGLFRNIHVNFKLVELEKGFNSCIDPVYEYSNYTGVVKVVKPINPHLIPARYLALIGSEEVILESLREIYAELKPGKYYVQNARLESRTSGRFLVPDLGSLRPVYLA